MSMDDKEKKRDTATLSNAKPERLRTPRSLLGYSKMAELMEDELR